MSYPFYIASFDSRIKNKFKDNKNANFFIIKPKCVRWCQTKSIILTTKCGVYWMLIWFIFKITLFRRLSSNFRAFYIYMNGCVRTILKIYLHFNDTLLARKIVIFHDPKKDVGSYRKCTTIPQWRVKSEDFERKRN